MFIINFLLLILKEEFLDAVYWLRQVLSIIIGIALGILSVKGFIGILM
jgi:hypothetical protein